MINFLGDVHVKPKRPFLEGHEHFIEWLINSLEGKELMSLILLGDVFDRPRENGEVNALVTRLIQVLLKKYKEVICLEGNHDYSKRDNSALKLLEALGVRVIRAPEILVVQGKRILALPYIYPMSKLGNEVFTSMKDVYSDPEKLIRFFPEGTTQEDISSCEVLVGHFGDETCGEFIQDCDISWFKNKKILGHVHKRVSPNVLGSAGVTRRDEAGKESFLLEWNGKTFFKRLLPQFFDFVKVKYGDPLPKTTKDTARVFDITHCPDPRHAQLEYSDKYPNVFLGEFFVKPEEIVKKAEQESESTSEDDLSDREYLEQYLDKTKPTQKVAEIMRQTLGK